MVKDATGPDPAPSKMKAHCPRCDGERNCDIHGLFDQSWSEGSGYHSIDGHIEHRILQCRGCETVFYWSKSTNSEEYDHHHDPVTGEEEVFHYPTYETFPAAPDKKNPRPDWTWTLNKVDATLAQIMDEVYRASDQQAFILASIGLRTAFDRTTELLAIDPAISMEEKVRALLTGGWIGETEAKTLGIVAEAGNAAAHRAWSPDAEEFKDLLHTLEQFLERALLSGKRALAIANRIPAKQRRKKLEQEETAVSGTNDAPSPNRSEL